MKKFDLTPMKSNVSQVEINELLSKGLLKRRDDSTPVVLIPVMILVFGLVGVVLYIIISQLISDIIALLLFGGMCIVGVIVGWYYSIHIVRRQYASMVRLKKTAELNGFQFDSEIDGIGYGGSLFGDREVRLESVVSGTMHESKFMFGNMEAISRELSNRPVLYWSVIRIDLMRSMPHIVLDSITNNTSSSHYLPLHFKQIQLLSLEGNFNHYFQMYVPTEFGRDAYYIFTPHVMVFFIDRLSEYDIEIKDKSLYIYSPKSINIESALDILNILELIDDTVNQLKHASERYENTDVSTVLFDAGLVRSSF